MHKYLLTIKQLYENKILKICIFISGTCIFIMMFSIVADALARTFLNKPIHGTLELNQMLMVVLVFMSLAWTQQQKGHINVDFLVLKLSEVNARALNLYLVLPISLFLISMLMFATAQEAYMSFIGREYVFGIIVFSVWPGKIVVAFGFCLYIVQLLFNIIEEYYKYKVTA